jgi:hypothetical protein
MPNQQSKPGRWIGTEPTTCELCGASLSDFPEFIDARVFSTFHRRWLWALVCPDCLKNFGSGALGTGHGQAYSTTPPYTKTRG